MPRALWKGSISFGLVSIPVELHTAVRDTRPHFRMLHAEDRSPVKFQRVCQREGQPVSWDDLVRGYEYQKGRFVVITKEDFQAAALEKSRSIDILDFVRSDEIDDRFFETSYYLLPSAGGERAYALLREAMREEGRVAVAKFILREDQHLAAITVLDKALVLTDDAVRRRAGRARHLPVPLAARTSASRNSRWRRSSSGTWPASGTRRSTPTSTAPT